MPTVLRKNGFRFQIYTLDHEPGHVHVFKAGKEVILNLGDDETKPWIRENNGMSRKDQDQAVLIAAEFQDFLLAQWREIHG